MTILDYDEAMEMYDQAGENLIKILTHHDLDLTSTPLTALEVKNHHLPYIKTRLLEAVRIARKNTGENHATYQEFQLFDGRNLRIICPGPQCSNPWPRGSGLIRKCVSFVGHRPRLHHMTPDANQVKLCHRPNLHINPYQS